MITLRNFLIKDVKHFYAWTNDKEVAKNTTWEVHTSLDEAKEILRGLLENHPWFKAICLNEIPIGSISLVQGKESSLCRAEIGYVLAKAHWSKGIATLAVKEAIRIGFHDLKIQRIEALVDPENIASQKVLIKSGMTCEGLLKKYIVFKGVIKDRYIYSIINQSTS